MKERESDGRLHMLFLLVAGATIMLYAWLVTHTFDDHESRLNSYRDTLCAAWRAGEITLAPKDCPKVSKADQERDIEHQIEATAVAKAKEAR